MNPTQEEIHKNAVDHLFWQHPINIPEKLCLIHSEVSEAMEAYRNRYVGEGYDGVAEELADIVIRVFDLAEHLCINMEKEIVHKHETNKLRPIRHGKRF